MSNDASNDDMSVGSTDGPVKKRAKIVVEEERKKKANEKATTSNSEDDDLFGSIPDSEIAGMEVDTIVDNRKTIVDDDDLFGSIPDEEVAVMNVEELVGRRNKNGNYSDPRGRGGNEHNTSSVADTKSNRDHSGITETDGQIVMTETKKKRTGPKVIHELLTQQSILPFLGPVQKRVGSSSTRTGCGNGNGNIIVSSSTSLPPIFSLPVETAATEIFQSFFSPLERIQLFSSPSLSTNFLLEDYFCKTHGLIYLEGARIAGDDDRFWDNGDEEDDDNGEMSRQVVLVGDSPYDLVPDENHDPSLKPKYGWWYDEEEKPQVPAIAGTVPRSMIVAEMKVEGKSVDKFLAKLAARKDPFSVKQWKDPTVNVPEPPLGKDSEFGPYFLRMKKCRSCECEARARYIAKRGLLLCEGCYDPTPHDDIWFCSVCNDQQGCQDCVDVGENFHCDCCNQLFCNDCKDHTSCVACLSSLCEDCVSQDDFITCNICTETFCNHHDVFYCQVCNKWYCMECRESSFRGCCEQRICDDCRDFKTCEICEEVCCDSYSCSRSEKSCSRCELFVCERHDMMMRCLRCRSTFCENCMDHEEDYCIDCANEYDGGCSCCSGFSDCCGDYGDF